jgi:hypothetical protein
LKLEDKSTSGNKDIFTFTGNRTAAKKSYVLLFDPTSQKATLEPLSDAYTFNLATRNSKDVSSEHSKIYPKKSKDSQQHEDGDEDLFGEVVEDESGDPDPSNPYDFRHFLGKEKRGDESEYNVSSPDNRTGTGSAMNTPQLGARKPAGVTASKAKPTEPVQKKAKNAESGMFMKKKKAPAKKAQPPPPTINLERRASERPPPNAAPKPKAKAPGPKILSAEIVHSSDESDVDAEGEVEAASSPPRQSQRSPSPQYDFGSDQEEDDAEGESDDDGGLEIEVPDERPSRPRNPSALKSLGLGSNLGVGGGGFKSPSQGPISLASATSSAHGSPAPENFTSRNNRSTQDEIDFGDLGGVAEDAEGEEEEEEEEDDDDDGELEIDEGDRDDDVDVDEMDIGPPARQGTNGHDRKVSMGGAAAEEDEEDPLYQEMMAGLAGGDSSEESEEE